MAQLGMLMTVAGTAELWMVEVILIEHAGVEKTAPP